MVKYGVLFEVRTEFLNNIQTSFGFRGLIMWLRLAVNVIRWFTCLTADSAADVGGVGSVDCQIERRVGLAWWCRGCEVMSVRDMGSVYGLCAPYDNWMRHLD
jgi:hypothetical protein